MAQQLEELLPQKRGHVQLSVPSAGLLAQQPQRLGLDLAHALAFPSSQWGPWLSNLDLTQLAQAVYVFPSPQQGPWLSNRDAAV